MAADLRLSIAVALQRANRALKAIDEIRAAVTKSIDVALRVVDGELIATIDGQENNLGRVAGEDGEDGDSVSLDDVRALVGDWLAKNITQPKDGQSPTAEQIAQAADLWLEANVGRLRGKDADPVDVEHLLERLKVMAAEWLASNIEQPRDGRDPNAEEISLAVALWMEFNLAERLPSLSDLRATATEWLTQNIHQPADGLSVTDAQVRAAVESWMRLNYRPPKDGDPGKVVLGLPGVGIEQIAQVGEDTARIILTSGKHFDLKLPRGKAGTSETMYFGGASGISALQVQQMIEEAFADMGPIEIENNSGDQLRADSGEVEYSPGRIPFAIEIADGAGDHIAYTAPVDKAFRIRRSKAMPIPRGEEESPQITVKVLDADDALYRVLFIEGFISERQVFTCPVGGKVVVSLDIAARVSGGFNIEEFAP